MMKMKPQPQPQPQARVARLLLKVEAAEGCSTCLPSETGLDQEEDGPNPYALASAALSIEVSYTNLLSISIFFL